MARGAQLFRVHDVEAAWQAVKVTRGPKLGSDHYPVVVEMARVG